MIQDRMLFGRFLIEKRKINQATLDRALDKQSEEKISDKPRMLGSILLNDFKAFKNRVELQHYLKEFETYKEQIEVMYAEAKKYGVDPRKKLETEYTDLLEELETNETIKIRDLIRKIENVRMEIKNSHNTEELEAEQKKSDELLQDKNNLIKKIDKLKAEVKSLQSDIITRDNKINSLRRYLRLYYHEFGDITSLEKLPKLKKL